MSLRISKTVTPTEPLDFVSWQHYIRTEYTKQRCIILRDISTNIITMQRRLNNFRHGIITLPKGYGKTNYK